MMDFININVSAINYDKTSIELKSTLNKLEEMVHGKNEFKITDSEFAFGWYFFVASVSYDIVKKLSEQMGQEFQQLNGKGMEKKFLTWLTAKIKPNSPRFKLAIKEEMESSKYGIF